MCYVFVFYANSSLCQILARTNTVKIPEDLKSCWINVWFAKEKSVYHLQSASIGSKSFGYSYFDCKFPDSQHQSETILKYFAHLGPLKNVNKKHVSASGLPYLAPPLFDRSRC